MHVCEQEVITTSMNKKLKKLTAILLTVCLAFALCACSSGGSGTSQGTGQAQPAGGGQTTEAVQETVPAADHQAQQAETAAQTAEAGALLPADATPARTEGTFHAKTPDQTARGGQRNSQRGSIIKSGARNGKGLFIRGFLDIIIRNVMTE